MIALRRTDLFCKVRAAAIRSDILYVLGWFSATRLWLQFIGILTEIYIEPKMNFPHVWVYSRHPWLNLWGVLDTGWYLNLATHGYASAPVATGVTAGQANWAFFPAYPMISAWLASVSHIPVFAAMVIFSNVCFLYALILIRRESEAEFGRKAARATIAVLCIMPASYVFSSAYSESLFLLCIATTFIFIRKGGWVTAGLTAALATLTRNAGVGLELPLLISGWRTLAGIWPRGALAIPNDHRSSKQAWRVLVGILLPAISLGGFCIFLYLRTGDPVAFVSIQKAWNRHLHFPLVTLLLPLVDPRWLSTDDFFNYLFAWISVIMLIPLAYWRRWSLLAFSTFLVILSLSAGLTSCVRFTTTMLPVTMTAGALLAQRPSSMKGILIILGTVNGFMMVGWTLGLRLVM